MFVKGFQLFIVCYICKPHCKDAKEISTNWWTFRQPILTIIDEWYGNTCKESWNVWKYSLSYASFGNKMVWRSIKKLFFVQLMVWTVIDIVCWVKNYGWAMHRSWALSWALSWAGAKRLTNHKTTSEAVVNKFSIFSASNIQMPFIYKKKVFNAGAMSSLLHCVESWLRNKTKSIKRQYNK